MASSAAASVTARAVARPVTAPGADYMPRNWSLIKTYWLGVRDSLFTGDWDDEAKRSFDTFVDTATAVTEGMAEEMMRGLGEKAVLTTGVPASFNVGYWDMCWQRDLSWSTPWCVATLRVLSKLRSGETVNSLDLFAET